VELGEEDEYLVFIQTNEITGCLLCIATIIVKKQHYIIFQKSVHVLVSFIAIDIYISRLAALPKYAFQEAFTFQLLFIIPFNIYTGRW